MKIKAIVYTSNTGYTARYAEMLSAKTGLPAYTLAQSKISVSKGEAVIYMGWLMAGSVKGYKKAAKLYDVAAVCGVGLGPNGSQLEQVRKSIGASHTLPLFTLQGGMDREKLTGINKFMINMLVKMLSGKKDRTADDEAQLKLILKGGDYVKEENLSEVMEWYPG